MTKSKDKLTSHKPSRGQRSICGSIGIRPVSCRKSQVRACTLTITFYHYPLMSYCISTQYTVNKKELSDRPLARKDKQNKAK